VHEIDRDDFVALFKESIKGWVDHGDGWARYKWLSNEEKKDYLQRMNDFLSIYIMPIRDPEMSE
jgi:hypothetical protein